MATVEERPTVTQAAGTIEVKNPATGETIAHVPRTSPQQLAEMVARARAAQPGWEALGFEGRGRVLRRAQKWLIDNAERVIRTIVSETGKTYEDAQLAELSYGASSFGFWAKKAPEFLADEKVKTSNMFVKGAKLIVRYQPLGLIGVIGPWNYPLTNSFGDCIPALAAGNSVILKPARDPAHLAADGRDARGGRQSEGRLRSRAHGRRPRGRAHRRRRLRDVHRLDGDRRKVMERAAKTLTPVGLELGGKDPMIVLADANLERAANGAAYYSMQNAGQTCISVERVYVEEPVYDEFVAKLTDKVRSLRQGVPTGPATVEIGAITSPSQLEIIDEHVKDAIAKGARVTTGGHAKVDGDATYYEPTVIADADHTMEAMTEETFGPTLPVMKVKRDAEEAIRLANDSPYGLAGSVWTKDLKRGEEVARRVEAGAVCVNDAMLNYAALELPMGGWKTSGLGSRHGANGIRKYCAQQSLLIKRLAPKRDLHMFPYKARTTALIGKAFKFLYGRGKRD